MRKREMSYSDYGMTNDEVKFVIDICRNPNENEKYIIDTALTEINPYIAPHTAVTEKYYLVDDLLDIEYQALQAA